MGSRTITAGDGVALHVRVQGDGPDVVVLSGGPGCVHFLADDLICRAGSGAGSPIHAAWQVPKDDLTR